MIVTACSTVKEAVTIEYTYNLPRTTFSYPPSILKSGEQVIYTGNYTVNLDSILHVNGLSSGFVGTTYFTKCTVTISLPENATFAWLQSSRIEISKTAAFDSIREVGYVTDVDPASRVLDYTMNRTDIRPYLGSGVFYIRLLATPRIKQPAAVAEMYIDGQLLMRLQPLK
jgi:hypothetical protein